jgi:hypothetical protein
MPDGVSYIFFESSLELVIVIKIAILTLSFGVDESVSVRTSIGVAVSTIFVVAVVTHAFGIVLLIFVRAFHDLHCFAF